MGLWIGEMLLCVPGCVNDLCVEAHAVHIKMSITGRQLRILKIIKYLCLFIYGFFNMNSYIDTQLLVTILQIVVCLPNRW